MIVSVCNGCGSLLRIRYACDNRYYCVKCSYEVYEYHDKSGEWI